MQSHNTRHARIRLCFVLFALLTLGLAQDSNGPEHVRKVIYRVEPGYPELARRMRMTGTVRLVAVVAPNGTVKQVEPVGGNPVLLKSAEDAVIKWKYAPASSESKESIELFFSPE